MKFLSFSESSKIIYAQKEEKKLGGAFISNPNLNLAVTFLGCAKSQAYFDELRELNVRNNIGDRMVKSLCSAHEDSGRLYTRCGDP